MPSFDIVSEINEVELTNSLDHSNKELATRFDFKGSNARIDYNKKEQQLTLYADDDFKLGQLKEILISKMTKRGVDPKILGNATLEKISGNKLKETISLKNGIEQDLSKQIIRLIKDSKLKVQASIQGQTVRVTGAKRDDLQAVMTFLKNDITEQPLQYNNFRD